MPIAAMKSLAEIVNKPLKDVEELYKKAKKVVKREYPDKEEGSEDFYKLVWGVLKKMLGISESLQFDINESKTVDSKKISKFLLTYKGDPADITDELVEKFHLKPKIAARVILVYVNKVKYKKYKKDSDFEKSIENVLLGKKGLKSE